MSEKSPLILVLLYCLTAAAVAQDAPLRAQAIGAPAAPVAAVAPRGSDPRPDLELKPGDIVSVNVFGEPSLTGAFPVGPGGEIVFPLLGSIPAAGHTAAAIGSDIKARLEADYIRSTQVSVAIAEEAALAPNTVTVIGQVTRPGQVAFEQGATLDLFTAIATAGGLTEQANRSRIELKRREGSDLRTQILELESNRVLRLQDKDTLIVHALPVKEMIAEVIQTVSVIGEVRTPGQIPMKKDQPLDIITAVAMAGGFTPTARPSKVFVRRPSEGGGVQTFEVNISKMQKDNSEPFMLAPNDTVTVPQSVF
jgi:polysaccharide export outer membrane protein